MIESREECLDALERARRLSEKLRALRDRTFIDDSDLDALDTSLGIAYELMSIKSKQAEGGRKNRLTKDSPQITQALEFIKFRRGLLGPDPVYDYQHYIEEEITHGRNFKRYKSTQARLHLKIALEVYKAEIAEPTAPKYFPDRDRT